MLAYWNIYLRLSELGHGLSFTDSLFWWRLLLDRSSAALLHLLFRHSPLSRSFWLVQIPNIVGCFSDEISSPSRLQQLSINRSDNLLVSLHQIRVAVLLVIYSVVPRLKVVLSLILWNYTLRLMGKWRI